MQDFIYSDKQAMQLFIQYSHHTNTSVIFVTQNMFGAGKYAVQIRRNLSEIIIFADKGDRSVIRHLNSKIFPHYPKYLLHALQFTEDHFPLHQRYIFIDKSPVSPLGRKYQVRTNIIPVNGEFEPVILMPPDHVK